MFHTLIFDIGGTLIESGNIFDEVAEKLNSERKREISDFLRKKFLEQYSRQQERFLTLKEMLAIAIRETAKEFKVKNLGRQAGKFYRDNVIANGKLFDDTITTLEKLKGEGIKLIALSDADKDILYEEMKRFGIFGYFEKIIVSSEVKAYKPSDKIVGEIVKACNGSLSGVLFIGDSIADVMTAVKMNVPFRLINRSREFHWDPGFRIYSLEEIFGLLE